MIDGREMLEVFGVPDTFVSGLGEVENLGGGCYRFVFYCRQGSEMVVAAKLVMPLGAIPEAMCMTARGINACACDAIAGMTRN